MTLPNTTSAFKKEQIKDLLVNYEWVDYSLPWESKNRETVFMYHGYIRNALFWQAWVPLLSNEFKSLRMDARGCGETSVPDQKYVYTFEQLADDAVDFFDHLKIDKVHWVGESSGGIVGLAVALKYPERLHSLTLCDTPFKRPTHIDKTYTLGEVDRATAFEKHGIAEWCRQTLSFRLDTNRASQELCEWYIQQMDKTPIHVANSIERMIGQGDFWPLLPQIKTPTLILAGRDSPIAQEKQMSEMQQHMPKAKLVAFDGYRHGINLIAPDRCVTELKSFIQSLEKGK
jgi:3-oxoadipate enol-lactonase